MGQNKIGRHAYDCYYTNNFKQMSNFLKNLFSYWCREINTEHYWWQLVNSFNFLRIIAGLFFGGISIRTRFKFFKTDVLKHKRCVYIYACTPLCHMMTHIPIDVDTVSHQWLSLAKIWSGHIWRWRMVNSTKALHSVGQPLTLEVYLLPQTHPYKN